MFLHLTRRVGNVKQGPVLHRKEGRKEIEIGEEKRKQISNYAHLSNTQPLSTH